MPVDIGERHGNLHPGSRSTGRPSRGPICSWCWPLRTRSIWKASPPSRPHLDRFLLQLRVRYPAIEEFTGSTSSSSRGRSLFSRIQFTPGPNSIYPSLVTTQSFSNSRALPHSYSPFARNTVGRRGRAPLADDRRDARWGSPHFASLSLPRLTHFVRQLANVVTLDQPAESALGILQGATWRRRRP